MYEEMKARAVDLGKTASSSDVIFDALRDEIISGQLKAGESIRQESIAKIFNVSRIPVREALKRLEAQGLVKNERYKGAVVSSLNKEEIAEIYELRANLEPFVIRHSVENMRPETLREARTYCESFNAETEARLWGERNRKFHETLYRDANRPYHMKIISEISDRIDPYVRAQLVWTQGMGLARVEHTAILEACEQGDADLAAELTRKHIEGSFTALITQLDKQQLDME